MAATAASVTSEPAAPIPATAPAPLQTAVPAAASAAAPAEVFGALPWQTISSGEVPNVHEFLAAHSQDAVSEKPESVRAPAIALIPTSVLAFATALLVGDGVTTIAAMVRFGLEIALAASGIRTARKEGPPRHKTASLSRATASVQLASIALLVVRAFQHGGLTPEFAPALIAILVCLALTLRIAALTFGRAKQ